MAPSRHKSTRFKDADCQNDTRGDVNAKKMIVDLFMGFRALHREDATVSVRVKERKSMVLGGFLEIFRISGNCFSVDLISSEA